MNDLSTHPIWVYAAAIGAALAAWWKFRLGRWDQQAVRIRELEAQVADLQRDMAELVDLKVANALLGAENERLKAENERLLAAAHQRRSTDVL